MLSKRSQTRKNAYSMVPFALSTKLGKLIYMSEVKIMATWVGEGWIVTERKHKAGRLLERQPHSVS